MHLGVSVSVSVRDSLVSLPGVCQLILLLIIQQILRAARSEVDVKTHMILRLSENFKYNKYVFSEASPLL